MRERERDQAMRRAPGYSIAAKHSFIALHIKTGRKITHSVICRLPFTRSAELNRAGKPQTM
jgi:hypothetical protein